MALRRRSGFRIDLGWLGSSVASPQNGSRWGLAARSSRLDPSHPLALRVRNTKAQGNALGRTHRVSHLQRRGLTLLEMLLVLVILTAVATIAVESIEPQVDQSRFEATQETINNVDDAIYEQHSTGDGRAFQSGFFVDMGRLPQSFNEPGTTVLTLRELWDASASTTNLPEYTSVVATPDNVETDTDADGDTIVADSNVVLAMGWRGPYLKLPLGANTLRDGWANELVSFTTGYSNSATYPHLRGDGDTHVVTAGTDVFGVRSLGADDIEDSVSAPATYERDLPAIPTFGSNLRLTASQLDGTVSGTIYVDDTLSESASDIVVQVYYPDEASSNKFAVQQAEVSASGATNPSYHVFDFRFDDGSSQDFAFPVGSRVIRAYMNSPADTSGDFSDDDNDPPNKSRAVVFALFSNNNSLELTINN